ncbi:MAG: acetyl-CoA carboxylase biotin carboxyl carrier protein [Vicinamibacteria bacterium]|nr:acetyl-CoA carboxylase biotin carboxyl carrier protein [Vicinamibacteria bacterium]
MDVKDLKEILRTLDERQITEFELETEGMKLRVRKASAVAPATVVVAQAPAAPAAAPALAAASALAAPAAPVEEAGLTVVKSPIVGTFYRAPNPDSPAFVNVGDKVRLGQVLCIIEAMKLMNEIESDAAGEIVKCHVENGQPVQYGDPLFSVRPAK